MKKSFSLLALLCFLFFLPLACGGDEVRGAPGSTGEEVPADCGGDVCTCPGSLTVCTDICADLSINFNHCGSCGSDCSSGEECSSGLCVPIQCNDSLVACDGTCVDLSSDREYCGSCDRECFPGEQCISGQCVCPGGAICNSVGREGRLVGGSCSAQEACDEAARCLQGGDFPDGTCAKPCETNADCPANTACVDMDGGVCLLTCRNDEDCRDEYDCEEVDTPEGGEADVCLDD